MIKRGFQDQNKIAMARLNFLLAFFTSCIVLLNSMPVSSADIERNYLASNDNLVNPDRGFYHPITTHVSSFVPLMLNDLLALRTTEYQPFQANYSVKSSLVFRHYVLDSYVNTDVIPESMLDNIQDDFDIARAAGIKLIVRFSYTISPVAGACSAGFICPPYGDAPKARVIGHIRQLSGVLSNNEDVLSAVQQGFIGTWGENYYTDYFGDSSVNASQGYLTNQNWTDRNEVLGELLNGTPDSRMVQVRYPQLKQRYLGGVLASITFPPISASSAYSGTDASRIGFHNDCFVASADDFGTYVDYGNDSSTVSSSRPDVLLPYTEQDSQFVVMGGETCADNYNPQNNCASGGGDIINIMSRLNFSYLNSDYNNAVNNDWQSGGCMDEIKKRLGYRFVLKRGVYPDSVPAGGVVRVSFDVENVGFSAPFNKRVLYAVLKDRQTAEEYSFLLTGEKVNTQTWQASVVTSVEAQFVLGNELPIGDYELFLHIADDSNAGDVRNRPEFSIQLANQNMWVPSKGYNDLGHIIKISETTLQEDDILQFIPAILSTLKSRPGSD